jgi:regulatory protein
MPKKAPRKITRPHLVNVANAYLERWPTSRANLRRVLMRRVDRSLQHHGGSREECAKLVDDVLDGLERGGALNDAAYAEAKVRSLVARGNSERGIRSKLWAKGVTGAQVDDAVDRVAEDGDPTLRACAAYVRKRRLGPYREEEIRRAERADDLAKLGRAGFPYAVARRVLEMEDPDEVTALARGLE